MGARALFGRRVIYTDVAEINAGNIIDVLQKALFVVFVNKKVSQKGVKKVSTFNTQ